jgi:hypothetical protein
MKPSLWPVAAALMVMGGHAQAASVNVTAEFTALTLGPHAFGSRAALNGGAQINGINLELCNTDAACDALYADPTLFSQPLAGSSVSFGFWNPQPEWLNGAAFAGNAAEVAGTGPANAFKLGTFTFTNGLFYDQSFLDLTLTTHSTEAALDNQVFSGRIRLDVYTTNKNPPVPLEEADSFTLTDGAHDLAKVWVEDLGACSGPDPRAQGCTTGTVDVYGYIDSLHVTRFANPQGGAVLAVLEPGTPALMLAGLGALGLLVRRRMGVQRR